MTQQEHLKAIVAKCLANLALAEKRTQGEWDGVGSDVSIEDGWIACPRYGSGEGNAAYISACAGAAEAGWRSTIAAIAGLQNAQDVFVKADCNDSTAWFALTAIRAAWPEELL